MFVASLVFLAPLRAQNGDNPSNSAKDVVINFCELDARGEQLNPDGQKEFAPLMLDARAMAKHQDITVIKAYAVRDAGILKDSAEFAVDYSVVGRLDVSLHFDYLAAQDSNQLVSQSEKISLVRSDSYYDVRSDGQWQQVKGTLEWRIKRFPSEPHIDVGTAIGYVRSLSFKSRDPVLKMNAQKALAELEKLYQLQARPPQLQRPTPQSPATVLSQFITMEVDGVGLTPDGLRRLNALSTQPLRWRQDKIRIAKAYSVKEAPFSGSTAQLSVEYVAVGELDSSLRFTPVVPSESVARQKFGLVFDGKYTTSTNQNGIPKDFIGPSRWRVADVPSEQWLNVNATVRYVTEMRDTTRDPIIKRNAENTLGILAHY